MAAAPPIISIATLLLILISATATSAYTNHTVGGAAGWFYNSTTNASATDYSKWAASQTFSLGDFLIFNTNSDQTVIQTYNETTYKTCDADDASDTDTFVYGGGDPATARPTAMAVALTKEGKNYYFSDGDDGGLCAQGMAFEIAVEKGQGLPPSLNRPPPPPYVSPPFPATTEGVPSGNGTGQQETFYNGGGAANVRMCCGGGVLTFLVIFFFVF